MRRSRPPLHRAILHVPLWPGRRAVIVGAAAAAMLIASILLFVGMPYLGTLRSQAHAVRLAFSLPHPLILADAATGGQFSVSPDGRMVGFVAAPPEGTPQLWIRPLESLAAEPLAGTEGATYPFWSPDGRFVAFFAQRQPKKVAATGGPVQILADAVLPRGGTWNREGVITQGSWTSPFTNKLLFEAGVSQFASRFGGQIPGGALTNFIPVREQVSTPATGTPVGNFSYRGWVSAGSNEQAHNVWRASAAFVTGSHSLKVGYQAAFQVQKNFQNAGSQISYVFNNRNPIQYVLRDAPFWSSNRTRFDAFYIQDQFTRGRLTLQGGLRYEHAWSWFPEGENGVVADNPYGSRFIFPERDGVTGYHDITPRMGAAFDLFGNGKTSLKVNFSKYLQAANNDAQYTIANPATTFKQTTNVAWTDSDGDKVVDCNVMNRLGENNTATGGDVCGPWLNGNFGNPFSTTVVNPDVLQGWGVRPYDWQYSVGVQHELVTRVAIDVNYSRRSWGNHFFTDNRALTPADFDTATIAAPSNPDLPNGGGYPVTFVTRNARSPIGAVDNYYTFAEDFGDVTTYWHGVDFTVNARTNNGITFQGGTSTGRGVRDYCNITNALPELFVTVGSVLANAHSAACAVDEPWLTTYRSSMTYTVPKIDVLLAGSIRSTPNVQPSTINTFVATNGASLPANYNVNSAILGASNLARPLAPGLPFQTVDLTLPGQVYPDRVNSVDLRVAKVLRFGRYSTNVGFDFYNLLNANTGTAFQQVYNVDPNNVVWGRPTSILNPRFARFNVTVNF